MVLQLLGQINEKTRENFDLQCQLDWLKRQLFGRRSEKMDPNQRLLFEDLFAKLQKQLEQQPVPEATETRLPLPRKSPLRIDPLVATAVCLCRRIFLGFPNTLIPTPG